MMMKVGGCTCANRSDIPSVRVYGTSLSSICDCFCAGVMSFFIKNVVFYH